MPTIYEHPENTYIIDSENGVETGRLIEQDRLITQAMGGVLAEQPPEVLPKHAHVLDLACGPGTWACDLAFTYETQRVCVSGIDINPSMVHYARAVARSQRLDDDTNFAVMDLRQPLRFPDQTFDLINGRFLVGVLDPASWSPLLVECRRVLKPGGILRLTECEVSQSSSPTLQWLNGLLAQALWQQGRSFSADGRGLGMVHRLGKLLLDAGCVDMQQRAFLLDTSFYRGQYQHVAQITQVTFAVLAPYLVSAGLIDEVTLQDTLQQVLLEMLHEDFTCLTFGLTAWARKPAPPQTRHQETAAEAVPLLA